MMRPVTDPEILARLNAVREADTPSEAMASMTMVPVTDPAILGRLNALSEVESVHRVSGGAVDNYIKAIQSGRFRGQGSVELAQAEDPDFVDRYVVGGAKQVALGFASLLPSTATVVGGLAARLGLQEGSDLAQWGNSTQRMLDEHLAVKNPNLYHHVMSGIGSMLSFGIPSLGVFSLAGKAVQTAKFVKGGAAALKAANALGKTAELTKAGAILQKVLGLSTMSVLESGIEMADRQRTLMDQGMTADQASAESGKIFWQNLPVLMATNYGFFHPATRFARMALEAPSEGLQERWQAVVQDVANGTGKWSDFLDPSKYVTETAVGSIVGSLAAGAIGNTGQGTDPDSKNVDEAGTSSDAFDGPVPEGFELEGGDAAPLDAGPMEAPQSAGPEVDAEMRQAARDRDSGVNVETPTSEPIRTPEEVAGHQRRAQVAGRRAEIKKERAGNRMESIHRHSDDMAKRVTDAKFSQAQVLSELERGLSEAEDSDVNLTERLDADQLSELEAMVRSVYANPDAYTREDLVETTVERAREMLLKGSKAGEASPARTEHDQLMQGPSEVDQAQSAMGPQAPTKWSPRARRAQHEIKILEGGEDPFALPSPPADVDQSLIDELGRMAVEGPAKQQEKKDIRKKTEPAVKKEATPEPVADVVAEPKPEPKAKPKPLDFLEPVKPKAQKTKAKPAPKAGRAFMLPIEEVTTEPETFQTRKDVGPGGFNEEFVANKVENYDQQEVDTITVWKNKKGKWVALDGHHTREIESRSGSEQVEVKEFVGTRKEAIQFSKTKNDSRRSNDDMSRAATARGWRESGASAAEADKKGKGLYGKNWPTVRALSYLNPGGRLMSAITILSPNADAQGDVMKMARWIGDARKKYPTLTDAHETEMFKWLEKNMGLKGVTTSTRFDEIISSRGLLGLFDGSRGLNLNKVNSNDGRVGSFEPQLRELEGDVRQIKAEKAEKTKDIRERIKSETDPAELSKLQSAIKRVNAKYDEQVRATEQDVNALKAEWRAVQDAGSEQTLFFQPGDRGAIDTTAKQLKIDPNDIHVVPGPTGGEWDVVRRLGVAIGSRVVFVEHTPGGVSTPLETPGWYNPGSHTSYIDVNNDWPVVYVALHEIGHDITIHDEQLMDDILEAIRESAIDDNVLFKKYQERYGDKHIPREIVADMFAQTFSKPENLRKLYESDRNAFMRVVDRMLDMIGAIRLWLKSEGLELDPYFKSLEKIESIIVEATSKRVMRQAKFNHDTRAAKSKSSAQSSMFFRLKRNSDRQSEIENSNDSGEMKEMLGRTAKVEARLDKEGKPSRTSQFRSRYKSLVDRNHPVYTLVDDALKAAGKSIGDLGSSVRPDHVLQLMRGWTGRAAMDLRVLEGIIKKHKLSDDIDHGRFGQWFISRRYMSVHDGKLKAGENPFAERPSEDNIFERSRYDEQVEEYEKHKKIVAHYAETNPGWEAAAKDFTEYSNKLLKVTVEAGNISQEAYDSAVDKYDIYAPMLALEVESEMAATRAKGGAGKVLFNQGELLADIARMDPLQAIIKATYRINHLAAQNVSKTSLVDVVAMVTDDLGAGVGRLARRVKKKEVSSWKTKAEMFRDMGITKKADQEAALYGARLSGINIEDGSLETAHQIWVAAQQQENGVITIMRDGKAEYWQVDPELFDVFVSQSKGMNETLRKFFSTQTTLLRAGAILTPEFMARNPLRDVVMAAIQSHHLVDLKEMPAFPVVAAYRLAKGLSHVIKKDGVWEGWMRDLGGSSEQVSFDRHSLRKNIKDLTRKKNLIKNTVYFAKHPIELLQVASEATEQATRVAVYERTLSKSLAKGMSEADARAAAGLASRRASIDFGRSGELGAQLNTIVPFFNAGIQGTDQLVRTLSQGSKEERSAAWIKLIMLVTVPSLLSWAINHDKEWYKEMPLWQKNAFWHIELPNGVVVHYPKPFEAGIIFGTLPERLLDYAYLDDPKAMKSWAKLFVGSVIPIKVKDFMGPAGAAMYEANANYDSFREAQIVRGALHGVEPRDQFTQSTTSTAKALGNLYPGGGISPQKIEHIIRGSFGGLGMHALDLTSAIYDATYGKDEKARKRASQKAFGMIPVDALFVGRTAKSFSRPQPEAYSRSLDDWYELKDHVTEKVNTFRRNTVNGTSGKRLGSLIRREGQWIGAAKIVRKFDDIISSINASIRTIEAAPASKYTPKERAAELDELLVRRTRVARLGLDRLMKAMSEDKEKMQASLNKAAESIERKAR